MKALPKPHKRNATYQDVLDAPEHKVAELLDGDLYLFPRPAPMHAMAEAALTAELMTRFQFGRGGPGGWWILSEPELHFFRRTAGKRYRQICVPDLAGWRRERLPEIPEREAFFRVAPDWLCEVLSPGTHRIDRIKKLPIYAAVGVPWVWFVDPRDRRLDVHRRVGRTWELVATHRGNARVRVEPFADVILQLSRLWEGRPPVRANEPGAAYEQL